jgi:excinuclease ABC subunit C
MNSAGIISSLIKQYYDKDVFIPSEILIPEDTEDRAVLEEWLSEKREGRVRIRVPAKGGKKALVEMAVNNARHIFEMERLTS